MISETELNAACEAYDKSDGHTPGIIAALEAAAHVRHLKEHVAQKMTEMVDILKPSDVEIKIRGDGKVVWVNVDDVCRFRAKISDLTLIDERSVIATELNELIKRLSKEGKW